LVEAFSPRHNPHIHKNIDVTGSGSSCPVRLSAQNTVLAEPYCSRHDDCRASVVAPDAVLTAAPCVAEPGNTRVHFRGEGGDPILAEVQAIVKHPGYRADAVKLRVASIDLALIRLARPLPAQFKSVTLASAAAIKPGQNFRIAGFGVTNESANEMSPILRAGRIAARLPLSRILLWANDPSGHDTGACTGDSGGPIFAPSQTTLVAVIDWAEGTSPHKCGALTQGALIVPQRAWIEGVLSSWNSSNN
jgi:secreted trypsin-like serine protease